MSTAAELEILISTRGAEMSKSELAALTKQCKNLAESADDAGAATKGAGNDAEQAAKKLKGLDTAAKGAGRGAGQSVAPFKMMRGAATQLGYQVQDVAVQLQSGTHWMTVFGQQGSQVASLMGPGGALIGALIAIGAAIGTVIYKMQGSVDVVQNMKNKVDELKGSVGDLSEAFRVHGINQARVALAQYKKELYHVEGKLHQIETDGMIRKMYTPEKIASWRKDAEVLKKLVTDTNAEIFALTEQGPTPSGYLSMDERAAAGVKALQDAEDKAAQIRVWITDALKKHDQIMKGIAAAAAAEDLAREKRWSELSISLDEDVREQMSDGLAK